MRKNLRETVFWAVTLFHSVLGTCDRLKTASSAEKNKRLCGFGYNGSLPGLEHCDDAGHLLVNGHCLRTRHGERNLIDNTTDENLAGSTVRVIATPCVNCVKDLAAKGVKEIFYTGSYENALGKEYIQEICDKKRIKLEQTQIDWQEAIQTVFDKLAEPGGILHNAGYRLEIVKKELKKEKS